MCIIETLKSGLKSEWIFGSLQSGLKSVWILEVLHKVDWNQSEY